MGLFDRLKEPIFLKESSNAEKELLQLRELRIEATGDIVEDIEMRIRLVEAGINGEKTIRFELANSHIPMYVLHDLYLEHGGLAAQIDYLLVTRKAIFVLECKNLQGNIEINSSGDFIRTFSCGMRSKREGIYSPITQNRRHLELIKQIRAAEKANPLSKMMFERGFYQNYQSVVVLSNPKTILNDRYAKKEIRQQVIRADQLVEHLRAVCDTISTLSYTDKEMEDIANFFLKCHKEQTVDYTATFREAILATREENIKRPNANNQLDIDRKQVLCPKCGAPMVRRTATKGSNAGKDFYGCSKFPNCRGIVSIP